MLRLPDKILRKIILYTKDIHFASVYDKNLIKLIYDPKIHDIDTFHKDISILETLIDEDLIDDIEEILDEALIMDYQALIKYTWNILYKDPSEFCHEYISVAVRGGYIDTFYTLFEIYLKNDISLSFINNEDLIEATEHNNVEVFTKLHQLGANITIPEILYEAYINKSYDLVDYLEGFIDDGDDSLMNKNNWEYITRINVLKRLNLPNKILKEIILQTNDINLICAFDYKLAKKTFGFDVHENQILSADNVYLLDILINGYLVYEDHEFAYRSLDFGSTNIYTYLFIMEPDFGQYDYHLRLSICNNHMGIFEFLLDHYIKNDWDLSCIGRDTMKSITKYDNVDFWKRLEKYGARINQPSILKMAKYTESYKIVDYLESLYLFNDEDDSDCEDDRYCCDDSDCEDDSDFDCDCDCEGDCEDDCEDGDKKCDYLYYTSGKKVENLLRYKTDNAAGIIYALKQLKLPYEILEKIIINTENIYLITILDPNLVTFMNFTDINTGKPVKRYIKLSLEDNLVDDIYIITEIMIKRNCIDLVKFLTNLINKIDRKYICDDLIELAEEFNHIEILEILNNSIS